MILGSPDRDTGHLRFTQRETPMRPLNLLLGNRSVPIWGVIAILFLSTQFFGLAHAAEHGDPSHHHDGAPCAIQFIVETAKGLLTPSPPHECTPSMAAVVPCLGLTRRVFLSQDVSNRSIRGPPPLLL